MTKSLPALLLAASLPFSAPVTLADDFDLDFKRGVDGWRTVLDGVMGGLSTGRVTSPEDGTMRFSGDLSLENNGGFSQARLTVDGDDFVGTDGVEISVLGDGRTYKFQLRVSNVRTMAGAYEVEFDTTKGSWTTIRLPYDDFRLTSFGRLVRGAPEIVPANIESLGFSLSDKKPGPFVLDVRSISAYGGESESEAQSSGNDLVSVAKAAGLTTLLDLVVANGLELPGEPVTIFAPTNEAFAALPADFVRSLQTPEGADTLRSILTYHVTTPALPSSQLLSRRSVGTLNGQPVEVGGNGPLSLNNSTLVATDVPFDGGVVHVIDRVLVPELEPITTIASKTKELSTLVAAVDAAGLLDQLGPENGPWTVFAPLNSAFADLPEGVVEDLLRPENRQKLVSVLGLHVVAGRLSSADLLTTGKTRTLLGDAIEFSAENGSLRVGGSTIVKADIQAGNGVVHLIDAVLLPKADEPAMETTGNASLRTARLIERAINRGAPLFNAGQFAGCASVYELATISIVDLGRGQLDEAVITRLERGIAEADAEQTWSEKAWAYRRAFDDVLPMLMHTSTTMSASLR